MVTLFAGLFVASLSVLAVVCVAELIESTGYSCGAPRILCRAVARIGKPRIDTRKLSDSDLAALLAELRDRNG